MRTARLVVLAAMLAATLVLGGAGPATACSCGDISDADAFEAADAVFIGTPIRFHDARDGGTGFAVTVLRVSDVHKGEVRAEQAVATSVQSSCRISFAADEVSVVFARSASDAGDLEDGILYAASCTGTRAIGDGTVELPTASSPPLAGGVDDDAIAAQLGDPRSSLFPEAFLFVGVLAFVLGLAAWLNRSGRTVT